MVFSQLMDFVPHSEFQACVARHKADRHLRRFSCWDQWLCMAFAQLTHRESLRDLESCLRAVSGKLYHLGIRGEVSRSTLADANERRDWHVYADLAQVLMAIARPLYADEPFGAELDNTVYALDSTMMDVCLSLCPWAPYERSRGAVKMHTLLDLRGSIPTFVDITHGRSHDVLTLDRIAFEPGAFYVMDRGYLSFGRLFRIHQTGAFFVTRALTTTQMGRQFSRPVSRATGLRSDQTVLLTGVKTRDHYAVALRRVTYCDLPSGKRFVFLTNNFLLPALTIAQLYQSRWNIEVFFKWIKQHLRIKSFLGNSPNAIKTQIWVALSVYLLVAIAKKTLGVEASLYTFLQVVGLTAFEKMPILQVFETPNSRTEPTPNPNQLNLFNL
ncbi:MAG: family transposase [Bryobacterales bacterium]|nr:family transposase [Bryobacterales bacterium]